MYYLFLKNLDTGKSYRTCLSSEFGNFQRWYSVIQRFQEGKEIILDNLILKSSDLVDADSGFRIKDCMHTCANKGGLNG